MKIPVAKLSPNPQQPRKHFDQAALDGLAASMKEMGQQTPILAEDNGDGTWTIVQGERRWRAAKINGWKWIDATVRPKTNHDGRQRLEDAMIENVARDNMNVVDEAQGYKAMRRWNSVREISKKVGKKEYHIRNLLLIADLPAEIQELMASGSLPHDNDSIHALTSMPDMNSMIDIARVMAQRRVTGPMLRSAIRKFLEIQDGTRKGRKKRSGTPALDMSNMNSEPPEWDALYQLGKVPPWPAFTESVMLTCDTCSLRHAASETTCGACPLVAMCRNVMARANGRK